MINTHACHLHPCSCQIFNLLCVSMLALPQKTSKIAQETYLMRVSFSSVLYPAVCLIYPFFPIRAASNHQIMIIIEASGNPGFLERSSVRLKCTSFASHEKMPPKVLNDVDEIVVELGLVISNRLVITIEIVINVWRESLESFWDRTFVKRLSTPVCQIPKHH